MISWKDKKNISTFWLEKKQPYEKLCFLWIWQWTTDNNYVHQYYTGGSWCFTNLWSSCFCLLFHIKLVIIGMDDFRINSDFRIENFHFKHGIPLLHSFTRPSFCVKSSYYPRAFRRKSGDIVIPPHPPSKKRGYCYTPVLPSIRPYVMSHHCS